MKSTSTLSAVVMSTVLEGSARGRGWGKQAAHFLAQEGPREKGKTQAAQAAPVRAPRWKQPEHACRCRIRWAWAPGRQGPLCGRHQRRPPVEMSTWITRSPLYRMSKWICRAGGTARGHTQRGANWHTSPAVLPALAAPPPPRLLPRASASVSEAAPLLVIMLPSTTAGSAGCPQRCSAL